MPDDSTTPQGVNGDPGTTGDDDTQVIKAQDDATATETDKAAASDTADAAGTTRAEKMEKQNRRFSTWRKQRPFAAGLLMMLAGIVIMVPTYLSLSIEIGRAHV